MGLVRFLALSLLQLFPFSDALATLTTFTGVAEKLHLTALGEARPELLMTGVSSDWLEPLFLIPGGTGGREFSLEIGGGLLTLKTSVTS